VPVVVESEIEAEVKRVGQCEEGNDMTSQDDCRHTIEWLQRMIKEKYREAC
jgi:hypothetical protein